MGNELEAYLYCISEGAVAVCLWPILCFRNVRVELGSQQMYPFGGLLSLGCEQGDYQVGYIRYFKSRNGSMERKENYGFGFQRFIILGTLWLSIRVNLASCMNREKDRPTNATPAPNCAANQSDVATKILAKRLHFTLSLLNNLQATLLMNDLASIYFSLLHRFFYCSRSSVDLTFSMSQSSPRYFLPAERIRS